MFRLAECDLRDRRVLVIEDDDHTTGMILAMVERDGGIVVGAVPTVEHAVASLAVLDADIALVHVRYLPNVGISLAEIFRPHGVEVQFMECFDHWYDFENDVEEACREKAPVI